MNSLARCVPAIIFTTLISLLLVACSPGGTYKSLEELEQQYGAPATKAEIVRFVSGTTAYGPAGGTYYAADGSLRGLTDARYSGPPRIWVGTWRVENSSRGGILVTNINYLDIRGRPTGSRSGRDKVFIDPNGSSVEGALGRAVTRDEGDRRLGSITPYKGNTIKSALDAANFPD